MTEQDKQLLLKDLCARLPYNVVIRCTDNDTDYKCFLTTNILNELLYNIEYYDYKPYLRPMSSMTEEEEKEIRMLHHCFYREGNGWITAGVFGTNDCGCTVFEMADILNYLNAHHFDYRDLIEKSLAIIAPDGMYKNK